MKLLASTRFRCAQPFPVSVWRHEKKVGWFGRVRRVDFKIISFISHCSFFYFFAVLVNFFRIIFNFMRLWEPIADRIENALYTCVLRKVVFRCNNSTALQVKWNFFQWNYFITCYKATITLCLQVKSFINFHFRPLIQALLKQNFNSEKYRQTILNIWSIKRIISSSLVYTYQGD